LLRLEKSERVLASTVALERRGARAEDPGVQRKIDALFGDTQKLLREHLRPGAIEQLRQELRTARSGRGA